MTEENDHFTAFPNNRFMAILAARRWMADNPVFLDTETTGLGEDDEICSLGVVDARGRVLVDTLVQPTIDIPPRATAIHGITDEMVTGAPTFMEVLPDLDCALAGHAVVIYNRTYDMRMLFQSARAHRADIARVCALWEDTDDWRCAMQLYATFHGEWSEYHGSYTWQSLSKAARQCGIGVPHDLHHACADAELTRQVVIHVAESPLPVWHGGGQDGTETKERTGEEPCNTA